MIKRSKTSVKKENIQKKTELDIESQTTTSQEVESAVNNSFFYTNDKFFEQMDSILIINHILLEYPNLNLKNIDIEIKHEMIKFVQDKDFIDVLIE